MDRKRWLIRQNEANKQNFALNPRADGVWQLTGPDEGDQRALPPSVSPEPIDGSEKLKRRSKDQIEVPQTKYR